jgi:hypothetical protein
MERRERGMSETLQGIGLFALSFFGFGIGTILFGVIINGNEYDDTGVYCGAWLIGMVVYAITVVMMWSRG